MALVLCTRKQLTLAPGSNVVLHGLSINAAQAASVMVIPLAPTPAWNNIDIVGQPTSSSVTLSNAGAVAAVVNVLFLFPHSVIGVASAQDYA